MSPGSQPTSGRDQQIRDARRARLPLPGPRRIVFLGCTSGAGQTVTALLTGHALAVLRGIPVAALDLHPGYGGAAWHGADQAAGTASSRDADPTDGAADHGGAVASPARPGNDSLTHRARTAPVATVAGLLTAGTAEIRTGAAGTGPSMAPAGTGSAGQRPEPRSPVDRPLSRLDVIAAEPTHPAQSGPPERHYPRLAAVLGRRYPLTVVDPGAPEVTRVLAIADQLVLVAPARGDTPRALAMTFDWLRAHGHGELAARSVTLVNGACRRAAGDVERIEAVARGRCRAIVRIPWDDVVAAGTTALASLRPPTRRAYTALAGVLVAGLAAAPVPGRAGRSDLPAATGPGGGGPAVHGRRMPADPHGRAPAGGEAPARSRGADPAVPRGNDAAAPRGGGPTLPRAGNEGGARQ